MSKFHLPLVFVLVLSLTVSPQMALAAPGDFIVTDSFSQLLLRVTPGGTVSVIASSGLGVPLGIAVDSAGDFIVTDPSESRLLRVTPGGTVSTIASIGLDTPRGVVVDSTGDFIVTDLSGSGLLLRVTPGGAVSTIASGLGGAQFLAIEPQTQFIGGELLPIDTTALLLAGAQSFSWMIPVILSGIGIGLFVVSRKSENS